MSSRSLGNETTRIFEGSFGIKPSGPFCYVIGRFPMSVRETGYLLFRNDLHPANQVNCVFTRNLEVSKFRVITSMREKLFQAFALAYMIGWLLARMPNRK